MRPISPTFESFTPTAGAREAIRLTRALVRSDALATRILVLTGGTGVGKTHLLRAAVRESRRRSPPPRALYTTTRDAIDTLIEAWKRSSSPDRPEWVHADVIALDDLHVLAGRERTQIELARVLGAAARRGCRVVMAAGGSVSDLAALLAELRAVASIWLVPLHPPTPAEMRLVLARGCRLSARGPNEHMLAKLALGAKGDVRRALGAYQRHQLELRLGASRASR